ncbi:hypothetical protein PRUPE_8G252900 [Prunus persica]|uniref:PREDICTED: F-box/kelch-repeat n=2 Tax=Prunus TaxID=3754 RepID=A0A5E4EFA9_PRUDU|nr:F-box/kelch-repeat protein At3g18720 [Prunus persica]XP_034229223.1 F-box/kelch-repeat protein At3g18720-like [Prunus dulcis]ONH93794.1 hypothetical protein PRUPE_8G252900 [Prunus persica]VVA14102.1 PREDICTED: F-box/kelch-repeat [Prunus dulcis]
MGRLYESHHEEDKSETNKNIPMLFLLGEFSGESNHAWLNPKNHTSNSKLIKFPELEDQTECLASGFGWLLIQSRNTSSLFFFNPFTRQRINLPYHHSVITAAAFSASPTSPDCIVFTYRMPSVFGVRIDTLLVGQETWTRHVFMRDPSLFGGSIQAIYNKGCFYCVDPYGKIATFDAKLRTWNIVRGNGFERAHSYFFEFNGEIFAVKKKSDSSFAEKLERLKVEGGTYGWEEVDLGCLGDDVTLFLGPYGSYAVPGLSNVVGMEKKKVFVADYRPQSKCLMYNKSNGFGMVADAGFFSWCYAPIWIQSS